MGKLGARRTTLIVVGLVAASLFIAPAAVAAPGLSWLVASPFNAPIKAKGETFFDSTIESVEPSSQSQITTLLAGSADNSVDWGVDDAIQVDVTRSDGSTQTLTHDFSNGCTGITLVRSIPLANLLLPGKNTIRIRFMDRCGVNDGNGEVWLYGSGQFSGGQSPTHRGTYVALGDSYASGEGNPPFEAGTDAVARFRDRNKTIGSCHRGLASWAPRIGDVEPYDNIGWYACSGSHTPHVADQPYRGEVGELVQMKSKGQQPDLVVVTIGGDDAGFAEIVAACFLGGQGPTCGAALIYAQGQINRVLGPNLTRTYNEIHKAAPAARILVVGYPNVMGNGLTSNVRCPWISLPNRLLLRDFSRKLDAKISATVAATAKNGDMNMQYITTLGVLSGHELCTGDSWVRAVLTPSSLFDGTWAYSAHPTKPGQDAILKAVAQYMDAHPTA